MNFCLVIRPDFSKLRMAINYQSIHKDDSIRDFVGASKSSISKDIRVMSTLMTDAKLVSFSEAVGDQSWIQYKKSRVIFPHIESPHLGVRRREQPVEFL